MSKRRPTIMAIGAHHDDNEIFAGTLNRHREDGWDIVSVVLTDGRYIDGKAAQEHVPIRENESRAAAKLLEMTCVFLHFAEGNLQPTDAARLALVRTVREYAPTIVITHPPRDYHIDHMSTSSLAHAAVLIAASACVLPEVAACRRPKLFYTDAWFVPFEPDEYVDVSDLIELKAAALACHKSQLPGEARTENDMIELAIQQSRTRGIEAGVRYAEAFRRVPLLGSVRLSSRLERIVDLRS